jgi:predicted aspartyl protease
METQTMGRVTTEATVENFGDVWNARIGTIPVNEIRKVVIPDALVDTGATLLSLPKSVIKQLGLMRIGTRNIRTSNGVCEVGHYGAIRLTIAGRDCIVDALEVPEGTPTLIGQIPLENLDFVVDLRNQRLIGNPAHGGEHMFELYGFTLEKP